MRRSQPRGRDTSLEDSAETLEKAHQSLVTMTCILKQGVGVISPTNYDNFLIRKGRRVSEAGQRKVSDASTASSLW